MGKKTKNIESINTDSIAITSPTDALSNDNKEKSNKIIKRSSCDIVKTEDEVVPMWWTYNYGRRLSIKEQQNIVKSKEQMFELLTVSRKKLEVNNKIYADKLLAEQKVFLAESEIKNRQFELEKKEIENRKAIEEAENEQKLLKIEQEALESRLAKEKAFQEEQNRIVLEELERETLKHKEEAEKKKQEKIANLQQQNELHEKKLEKERELLRLQQEKKQLAANIRAQKKEVELKKKQDLIDEEKKLQQEQEMKLQQAELAAINKLEAERNRIAATEFARLQLLQDVARDRELKEQEEIMRLDLLQKAEQKVIALQRRNHKIFDVAFCLHKSKYPMTVESNLLEFYEVSLKKLVDSDSVLNNITLKVPKNEISAISGFSRKEINAIINVILRDYDKRFIISSGELRYNGSNLTDMLRNEHHKIIENKLFIMPYDIMYLKGSNRVVSSYMKHIIGNGKFNIANDYLMRLNISNVAIFLNKQLCRCSYGELARMCIVCALLQSAELTILCEPQRCLDSVSRYALIELINEWKQINMDGTMLIFSSDDALSRVKKSI